MALDFRNMKKLSIAGIELKELLINGVKVWAGITNWITKAINTDGTPYRGANGEIGYKTGYRFNTANAETAASAFSVTGYIPAAPKDMFYFSKGCMPHINGRDIRMVLYDANFTLLGGVSTLDLYNARTNSQLISEGLSLHDDDSLSTITPYALRYWVTSATANKTAYVRFSTYTTAISANAVITKNEPI